MKAFLRALGALCIAAGTALVAHAQPRVPDRPITLVAPYPAGASTDTFARIVAAQLTADTGQQVIVENRAGASGNIAGSYVAHSPPDGTRILVATNPMIVINPHLLKDMGYDPLKDLRPVANGINTIVALAVHPSVPARTLAEFIAYGKAHPDDLFFGTAGAGTPHHIGGLDFGRRVGIAMRHVPYKGGAPMLADLMGGQIKVGITAFSSMEPLWKAGKIRILAIGEPSRVPAYPELPTFAETVPGFVMNGWTGFFVPAATPAATADRITKQLLHAMTQPAVLKQLADANLPLWPERDPASLAAAIRKEYKLYGDQVRDLHVTID